MAAEEKVVIKVEVDADITNDLAIIERRIKALEDRTRAFNRQTRDLDRSTDRLDKRFNRLSRTLKGFTGVFTKFITMMSKFSFIALAGQIGLFTAGLLAAKAALVTGRAAVSAYQASLRGLSVVAAGVATSLAVAAAAMREFQEAQLSPFLGGGASGRTRASRLNRSIGARMTGLLGSEATAAITGSFARSGVGSSQANALARQLFNITGGDAKAAQSLAAAFATGDFTKARTAVSGAAGFQKGSLGGVTNMGGLISAVAGGGATSAAFGGVAETMAGTFIGTLKTEFAGLKGIFADIGEPLLGPFRDAFLQISRILREDIISMTGALQKFGAESFAPTLVTVVDKISEFVRSNIINNMGRVEEMGQSFVNFFKGVRDFFNAIGGYLSRLEPAANVVIDMFKAMGAAAGGRGLFQQFNELITENADAFVQFGTSIGNVFGALFDQLANGQMGFFNKLPLLSDILDSLAFNVIPALFNVFNRFAPLMEQLPSALNGLAGVLNMLAPIIGALVETVSMLIGAIGSIPGVGGGMTDLLLGGLVMYGIGRKAGVFGRGARAAGVGGRAARAGAGMRGGAGLISRQFTAYRGARVGGSGVSGFSAMSTSAQRAGSFGKFSRVGKFAKAGKVLGPLGLALGGLELGMIGNEAYQTGNFTGGGILSGGLTGATLGSMILPGVGTVVGALIGGAVGAVVEGIGFAFGQSRIRNNAKKQVTAAFSNVQNMALAGSGSEAFLAAQNQADLFRSAIEAQIDPETGAYTRDGDTREFRDFLRSIGVDPDSVHRDNMMESFMSGDYLGQLESQLDRAVRAAEMKINDLAEVLSMGTEQIEESLNVLGIDVFGSFNEGAAAGLVALLNSPVIDRTGLILPDFSTSSAGRAERLLSAQTAMDTLIAAGSDATTADVSDFIDRFAAAEIAAGGSADIAGLSGLQEIRERVASGSLSSDVLSRFGIRDQEMAIFSQLEQQYGLGEGAAERLYASYSGAGFNVGAIDTEINRISTERERLRSGLLGGDLGAFASVAGGAGQDEFMRFISGEMFTPGERGQGGGAAINFRNAFREGDFSAAQEMIDQRYEGGTRQATIDFMIQSGDLSAAQIGILQQISENTANAPSFNITGDVSETSFNEAQIILTVTGVNNTGGGGPNSGGGQYG